MPRRLRIQYPNAIYHVMARGNGRQDIVYDDGDRERLVRSLERSVDRFGWRVFAFVLMSNHLHLVLKTPQPNLAKGMQSFLSAYANGWARRHRFVGHVFQGRYRTELVEDETYLWVVTRYVHLNPVRAGLVEDPAGWAWSSYRGYAGLSGRWDWVAYDELLSSWQGAFGGCQSESGEAYRRFVTSGLTEPPSSPLRDARHGWILGSEAFAASLRRHVGTNPPREQRRETRRLLALDLERLLKVVAAFYDVTPSELCRRGSRHPARAALAYLARRYTSASNGDLVPVLGLSRPESVPNLTRRFSAWVDAEPDVHEQLIRLEKALGFDASETTKNRSDPKACG